MIEPERDIPLIRTMSPVSRSPIKEPRDTGLELGGASMKSSLGGEEGRQVTPDLICERTYLHANTVIDIDKLLNVFTCTHTQHIHSLTHTHATHTHTHHTLPLTLLWPAAVGPPSALAPSAVWAPSPSTEDPAPTCPPMSRGVHSADHPSGSPAPCMRRPPLKRRAS